MDKLKDMFERLPKWAKIGVPVIIVAGIAYYIYKNKSSASSTLTEPAVGTADSSSGLPATSSDSTTPAVTPTPVTPSPKHNPQMASAAEIKLAAHWAAQDAKNAKAAGVKAPKAAVATKKMTEAQATAAYQRNKGIAAGIAAKKGKK